MRSWERSQRDFIILADSQGSGATKCPQQRQPRPRGTAHTGPKLAPASRHRGRDRDSPGSNRRHVPNCYNLLDNGQVVKGSELYICKKKIK